MARDHRPMTSEEIADLREKMDAQREAVRATLAEELGGDPEDYRSDQPVTDGGDGASDGHR